MPIINALSCSRSDVSDAIDLAVNGDIVIIPAGTASWTSKLVVTKGITIQGSGIDVTIIQDDELRTTTNDGTVFSFNTNNNFRLTNLTITHHNETTINSNTAIRVSGYARGWRIDHIKFDALYCFTCVGQESGSNCGVVDHCIAEFRDIFAASRQASWGAESGTWGDNSWVDSIDLGSPYAFYIEDNIFLSPIALNGVTDGEYGARMVVRFNTIHNNYIGSHGTESSQRIRGTVKVEVYGNIMNYDLQDWPGAVLQRSGILMMFKNQLTGYTFGARGINYRSVYPFPPWKGSGLSGVVDGVSVFDNILNSGMYYATGTHTGSNGTNTLIDNTKSWSIGQWSPTYIYPGIGHTGGNNYSIINITQGWSSSIGLNGTNTITRNDSDIFVIPNLWNTGDVYEIRAAYPALDQVGWSGGDLLSGGNGGISPTPAAWPHQVLTRSYIWGNTGNNPDGYYQFNSQHVHVQAGRDVITNESTPGVTEGTSLPGTCVVGAGFWKTDEGHWNSGINSNYTGQGVLYKCLTTNIWTLYYTPCVYPHPIINDQNAIPVKLMGSFLT